MTPPTSTLNLLYSLIKKLGETTATGQLVLTAQNKRWYFFFYQGQLAHATTQTHRVRRWYRALRKHDHSWTPTESDTFQREPWEYRVLLQEYQQQKLHYSKAKAILKTIFLEILFSLSQAQDITHKWINGWSVEKYNQPEFTFERSELKPLFKEVKALSEQWHSFNFFPSLSNQGILLKTPPLCSASSKSLLSLQPLLNGKRTFWDIVVKTKQSPTIFTRTLFYYLQQELIQFKSLPDLPNPTVNKACELPQQHRPLVICVDDSANICHETEKYLTQLGYQCICIQDSTQALPILLQHKPDLILLDLVMPVVNGYELCTHLRRVPHFKSIPVVLMTGNKSIIDRIRAKQVGATEIILKTTEKAVLAQAVNKYLRPSHSTNQAVPILQYSLT
ncbi:response regulator [Spirulina subsalsa]|uniref:response regulator n=1 Tax=Spirulina subsalsa TaxID=54311 RepID=UPI00031A9A7B|nr:response regulator [Spirulina subsalsa]